MGHDYNLPFGPWGMEVEPQMPLGEQYHGAGIWLGNEYWLERIMT